MFKNCGKKGRGKVFWDPKITCQVLGFTLVELLASIAILGILLALAVMVWPKNVVLAEKVKCIGNMRSLQASLAAYVQDVGHWPQMPAEMDTSPDDSNYEDWWLNELAPYGGSPEVWMCPTIKRLVCSKNANGRPKIHYTPTMFDDKPMTPYKWRTQPWLIEIGNMHGHGANICFPDGSIRTMDDVIKK